jgi:glycosyltransferase involved in cell wall biosynthesis
MITAVIIARNEEKDLKECISSLKFCQKIIVIDSNSTDKTADIAKNNGAAILKCSKENDFSYLRNYALNKVKTPWTLFIDADERVSPGLADEITAAVSDTSCDGFYLFREDNMWGRELKYGDVKSVKLLRLGKTKKGKWVGRVHETWSIAGEVGQLENPLKHYPHPDIASFLISLNHYSTIRAVELKSLGINSNLFSIICFPFGKFFHIWIIKLGFLDGIPGLVHAFCMSFYSFLVRSKLYLLSKGITDTHLR